MGTILLSIGDRVDPGVYELHSRFEHACNFLRGQHLVCVVDGTVGAGPTNIVLIRSCGDSEKTLLVSSGSVVIGRHRLSFTEQQRYHSTLRFHCSCRKRFRQNVSAFRSCLVETASPASLIFLLDRNKSAPLRSGFARALAARFERAAYDLFHGDLLTGIAGLRGCGPGLTPSGDDFIAGALIGLHIVQQLDQIDLRTVMDVIFTQVAGGNVFSNSFLDCARKGFVSERVNALIGAICEGSPEALSAATKNVLTIGSTSGADLAIGLYMTLWNQGEFARRYQQNLRSGADEIRVLPCLATMEVGA